MCGTSLIMTTGLAIIGRKNKENHEKVHFIVHIRLLFLYKTAIIKRQEKELKNKTVAVYVCFFIFAT